MTTCDELRNAAEPVWQTESCPPWSARTHRNDDLPADRLHDAEIDRVPMRRAPAVELTGGEWELSTVRVHLSQNVDSGRPWVHLFADNDVDRGVQAFDLDLDEVERLARVVLLAVDYARRAADSRTRMAAADRLDEITGNAH